jgi:glycerophosphoryl diester phosphodiesterase
MRVALPPALLRIPVAHRALHDRAKGVIENSATAVRAAMAAGYAIEIDVQLSADGQAMVFHDDRMERLTAATGLVRDHAADALGRMVLMGARDTIPTLDHVLTMVAGQVPLLIEIKDQSLKMSDTDGRLEAAVAAMLRAYKGDVAVMSFNPHSMAHMARLAPDMARGITTSAYDPQDWAPLPPAQCDALRAIPDYDRVGASFISHEAHDLSRPRVADLKAGGAAILCWTIRSPNDEAKARAVAQNVTFEGYRAVIPA